MVVSRLLQIVPLGKKLVKEKISLANYIAVRSLSSTAVPNQKDKIIWLLSGKKLAQLRQTTTPRFTPSLRWARLLSESTKDRKKSRAESLVTRLTIFLLPSMRPRAHRMSWLCILSLTFAIQLRKAHF